MVKLIPSQFPQIGELGVKEFLTVLFCSSVLRSPISKNNLLRTQSSIPRSQHFIMNQGFGTDLDEISRAVQKISARYLATNADFGSEPVAKIADADTAHALSKKYSTPDNVSHDINDVLAETFEISDYRMRMNHPCFFGFIPSPVLPLAWLGDVVSSAFNVHGGSRIQSSGPSAIEHGLIHWMAYRAGLPAATAGGIAVSGGSMANLIAMTAARDHNLPRDQWAAGVVYVSDQTHSSIAKGLRILGFQEHQVRRVPTDGQFRMRVDALRSAIQTDRNAGLYPFMVVVSCGTTNTGSVDPIEAIVETSRAEKLWVHVDGAYGATAMLCKSFQHRLKHLGDVDSISWDAHKWLFQTYGCGFVLMRDQSLLFKSFRTGAEYTQDAEDLDDIPNYWNLGLELTRPTRAMKLWFTLRVLGLDQISRMIGHGIEMAEYAEQEIRQLPNWEILSPASLAIVTFRFAPAGRNKDELDNLNQGISRHLLAENITAMLTTKVGGKVVLRICSISPHLSREWMKGVIEKMNLIAEDREMTRHLETA